ncbi:hypothetical protein [Streptomyces sp. S4.7]|uniref:hypothetical protein n=1 Tax=Streptomyces sp. S4.7 TaxID=2705439 RepID=UPI0013DAFBAB|nr:hypothetical protein [Streptomyces sp. S4.7]
MDGSPRLRDEDRADFATALDDVVASAEIQRRLEGSGHTGPDFGSSGPTGPDLPTPRG